MPDWLQWVGTIGGILGLGTALATWLKTRPAMKEVELKGEDALWSEIAELRAELKAEREECKLRINSLETVIADLKHDLNNESYSFDSFLMLAEANPEKVIELLPRIREERQKHKERMAMVRGAREGAAMQGAAKEGA